MSSLPKTPHDWALWLFATLEDVQPLGGDLYRGRLPAGYEYNEIVRELEIYASRVGGGVTDEGSRSIEFYPMAGNVYQTVDQLVETPANQGRVPDVFTIRELGYTTHGEPLPELIQGYFHAVQLWSLIAELADHVVKVPASVFFIESPTKKVEITLNFGVNDMRPLRGLDEFSRDFVRTDFHQKQKRDIVRSALIETFPNRARVSLGVAIEQFESFCERIKSSYAVFAADFSYQKVRSEIEKQNLDDTLRLNKTLADIQNQLLALPAALILAASGLEAGKDIKNFAIVIGVMIFATLMFALVMNQKSSVRSIEREVALRKDMVMKQPVDVSSRFEGVFVEISRRVEKQGRTLNGVLWLIAIVVICVIGLAWYQSLSTASGSVASVPAVESQKTLKLPATR